MKKSSEKYEYPSPIKLTEEMSKCITIPSTVILDVSVDDKRIAVFSFLSVYSGLNDKLIFSIDHIVKWSGYTPNRRKGAINSKFLNVVELLKDKGYLVYPDKLSMSTYIEAKMNTKQISQECQNDKFAIMYLDELDTILNYQNSNAKDSYSNRAIILLVFAYLRMKISRRKNKLTLKELNIDANYKLQSDIAFRRLRYPDVYDCYYFEIASDLGITPKQVSRAVEMLKKMELIYSESLPRIKYEKKWRTDHTLFCNTYKRESGFLLAYGKKYYELELKNKKMKLGIKDK